VERLSAAHFTLFLDVVQELHGDFLRQVSDSLSSHVRDILYSKDLSHMYVFERMDRDHLERVPQDSPSFIGFCKADYYSAAGDSSGILTDTGLSQSQTKSY